MDRFDGEWKNVKLSNICKITTGKKDVNEGDKNGMYPFFTCAQENTFSNTYSYDDEAILTEEADALNKILN